jgi:hypothetical protein
VRHSRAIRRPLSQGRVSPRRRASASTSPRNADMNSDSPPPNPSDRAGAGTSPRAPARSATCATTRRSNGVSSPPGARAGTAHRAGPAGPQPPGPAVRTSNHPRAARSASVAPNPVLSSRPASRLITAGGSSPGSAVPESGRRPGHPTRPGRPTGAGLLPHPAPHPGPPPSCGPVDGVAISRTTNRTSHPAPAMAATANTALPSDWSSPGAAAALFVPPPRCRSPAYLTRLPRPSGSGAEIDKWKTLINID